MIKGSIQEDTTIVNIYAPNTGAPQYIRQMLTDVKGEIDRELGHAPGKMNCFFLSARVCCSAVRERQATLAHVDLAGQEPQWGSPP